MIDCGGKSIRHIVPRCSSFSFLRVLWWIAFIVRSWKRYISSTTFPHLPPLLPSPSFSSLDALVPLPPGKLQMRPNSQPTGNEPKRTMRESSPITRVSQMESCLETVFSRHKRRPLPRELKSVVDCPASHPLLCSWRGVGRGICAHRCNDWGKRRGEGTPQTSGDFFLPLMRLSGKSGV